MLVVATILFTAILLWVGLYPTHLIFHTALKRMTAKYLPAASSPLHIYTNITMLTKLNNFYILISIV